MSVKLKNNKIIITKEVEIDSLVTKVNDITNPWEVASEVKREILEAIEAEIKPAIKEKLNLVEKIESADWSQYETATKNKIDILIEEEIQKRTDAAIGKYLKSGVWRASRIDELVDQRIEQHFTESIHPRISRLMDRMISINPVLVQEELESMHSTLNDAYESGQEAAANSIRNSI